jgi:hypothetical protein
VKKLEKEALLADREEVARVLRTIAEDDILGRLSFGARMEEIDEQLRTLNATRTMVGQVALLFGGAPTYGSRAIDATFVSLVLKTYQELISKRIAAEEVGELGTRGPIPLQAQTSLAITDVVRGSVGFVLEEFAVNDTLAETAVKHAIDDITEIIRGASSEQDEDFERAVESLAPRVLMSLKDFFVTLDEKDATLRIVDDEHDQALDSNAVRRGRRRVEATEIDERPQQIVVGRILGLFPHARRFEIQLENGEVIHGTVSSAVSPRYHELIADRETNPVGRMWRTLMNIRVVRELNRPERTLYSLVGLLSEFE